MLASMQASEKCLQASAQVDDIIEAINDLDAEDMLPDMFCEATDLLKHPSLSLDPVSEQLCGSRMTLVSLDLSERSLQEQFSSHGFVRVHGLT